MKQPNGPYNNVGHLHKRTINTGAHSGPGSVRLAYVSTLKEQNPVILYDKPEWQKTCEKYGEINHWNKNEKELILINNINKLNTATNDE